MARSGEEGVPVRLRLYCPVGNWLEAQQLRFGIPMRGILAVEGTPQADGRLAFDLEVRAVRVPASDVPNLRGPALFGDPNRRALYLQGFRERDPTKPLPCRMKVLFCDITWDQIQEAGSGGRVTTETPGACPQGGPPQGVYRPLWSVIREE
ncbi:MAG: hypothetical protein FJX77_03230 [Armatimonadetes bacterium]|nr:hypothetical protein [Armatimonadota bacterium]